MCIVNSRRKPLDVILLSLDKGMMDVDARTENEGKPQNWHNT